MDLFTAEDFAALFAGPTVPGGSGWNREEETLGLAWFGEKRTLPSMEDAQLYCSIVLFPGKEHEPQGYHSRTFYDYPHVDAGPWEEFFDTSAPDDMKIIVTRSNDGEIVLALNDNSELDLNIFEMAYFLELALADFSIKYSDITGKGRYFHPFVFTAMQDANVIRLRSKLASVSSFIGSPSELWALCLHAEKGLANTTILSFVETGEQPHEKPRLAFSAEALKWRGSTMPPTVCVFWRDKPEIEAVAQKKPHSVRIRVKTSY